MSKYIDLKGSICTDIVVPTSNGFAAAEAVLEWLDEHPGLVPGRRINQSRIDKMEADTSDRYMRGVRAGLILAGAEIAPDPNPTNAEKLEEILIDFECHPAHLIAEHLDTNGVTAPGGDES